MIISKDINPERDLYNLGGLVLHILNTDSEKAVGYFDVFQKLNQFEKVSVHLFSLTLDWLYLLDVIDSNDGVIEKCF